MSINSLPLRARILFNSGVPLILLVILASVAIWSSHRQTSTNEMVDKTHYVIEHTMELEAAAVDMETGMRGFLLAGDEAFLEPYYSGWTRFDELTETLKDEVSKTPALVSQLEAIRDTIKTWETEITEPAIAMRKQVGTTKTLNDIANMVAEARGKVYFDKFRSQIADFIAMEEALMLQRKQAADAAAKTTDMVIIGVTIAAIALAAFISTIVMKSIINPINMVVKGLEALAAGDLTTRITIKANDELGKMANSFNQAVAKTHDTVKRVLSTTDEVLQGSQSISQANTTMKQELEAQADKVTQISAAVEQMSLSIREVASSSAEATSSAQNAGESASTGGQVVNDTIIGMESINSAVQVSIESVEKLNKWGSSIGEIITVIEDIADQTNLLALNAAIEAARAGDAGRGFAVVADEVRTLADRTTVATREIADSIQSIQSETHNVVENMNEGATQVNQGVELAQRAGNSLDDIVQRAQNVAAMIDNIAAASEEQSLASAEVAKNVEGVSHASTVVNEQAHVASSSAEGLLSKAKSLQQLVEQFKVNQHYMQTA